MARSHGNFMTISPSRFMLSSVAWMPPFGHRPTQSSPLPYPWSPSPAGSPARWLPAGSVTEQGAFSLAVGTCLAGGTLGATLSEVQEAEAAISTATTRVRMSQVHLPQYEGSNRLRPPGRVALGVSVSSTNDPAADTAVGNTIPEAQTSDVVVMGGSYCVWKANHTRYTPPATPPAPHRICRIRVRDIHRWKRRSAARPLSEGRDHTSDSSSGRLLEKTRGATNMNPPTVRKMAAAARVTQNNSTSDRIVLLPELHPGPGSCAGGRAALHAAQLRSSTRKSSAWLALIFSPSSTASFARNSSKNLMPSVSWLTCFASAAIFVSK
jgi:hypothetical protein